MKLAVVGSRKFPNKNLIFKKLDEIHSKYTIVEIVSGGAIGVDSWAAEWSLSRLNKQAKVFEPNWQDLTHPEARIKINSRGQKYDANAGLRRNTEIVNYSEKVLAFIYNQSPGTTNTIKKAKKQDKILEIIKI